MTTPARRALKGQQVRRELLPNQSPELLRALHLLTREGHLNADALRKLKQVNHLVGLLQPALEDVFARYEEPVLVDAGSGNAYLGFVLYELFFKPAGKGSVVSLEGRAELSARAAERAAALGFSRMAFQAAHIDSAAWPERVHVVTALHACDTATDDALVAAARANADHVAVVPCCQAEVAAQLKAHRAEVEGPVAELFSHPWHRREFGSHLTNVLRALALEACGYSVTVTELAGWEHSLKNELILGKKVRKDNPQARARLEGLLAATRARPKLVRVLFPGLGAAAP
ncbi:MAG: SAM-dependent methyltransferase [Deltaproteobacteria bacterium]|nr:SAM-dependent methyltransferase [Deltaproteobacteria bacterium]